jgi:hypothetical protein
MAGFIEIANLDKLPPATGICLSVPAKEVAVFNAEGTRHSRCVLHQGLRWDQVSWKAMSLMRQVRCSNNGAGLKGFDPQKVTTKDHQVTTQK